MPGLKSRYCGLGGVTARWLAFGLAAAAGSIARADFIVSSSRYADGLDDVIVFRALNTGTNGQAGTTKLGSESVTMTSTGKPLMFDLSMDIDGDGVNDANVEGFGLNFPTSGASAMPAGSFIRIGTTASFFLANASPQPYSEQYSSGSPTASYANLSSFRVDGTISGGGVAANSSPAPFAAAVVPTGTLVSVSGQLAAESGSIYTFTTYTDVPEPAGGALLVMASIGLLARHRMPRSISRCNSRLQAD